MQIVGWDWKLILSMIGAFIHKKDRDFHRDWNTEIFLRLFRQAEISRWSPSGMILVTELCMPDIKHCPCFDTLAWNDGRENTKIICSSVHTSAAMQIIAIISEIFMSTLVKISRFRSRCKNWDLYPANSRKCECPWYCILMLRITLKSHSTICIFTRSHKKMLVSCKRDTKNVTNWLPYLWNYPDRKCSSLMHITAWILW